MKKYELYINGEFVPSTGQETEDVINPTTEEVIAQVQTGTKEDVDAAVKAARGAFQDWNGTQPAERARIFTQVVDGLKDRYQEMKDAIIQEVGSSQDYTDVGQVQASIDEMQATLEGFKNYEFQHEHGEATIIKEGIGVVAAVTPWNFPLLQIVCKLIPAILAGNTIVVKPASLTPISAMILADIIDKTDLPKGVFNLVTGDGDGTGAYLSEHEDVDVISFTGSTKVGSKMYDAAKGSIKHLLLELGGKSAMVYLEGGDLSTAVETAADTVLDNQGQTCDALTRLLVPEDKLEETNEQLKNYFAQAKVGDPTDSSVKVGPLVSESQMNRVLDYIEIGKNEGAELLVGGNKVDRTGYFVEPTVFTNVTNDMTIAREEIFGPVITVLTYKTVEEAIEIANDSPYGLSGAVVGPKDQAIDVAKQLRTGVVAINGAGETPGSPFGGYKMSGLGRENGLYAIDDYVEIKAIHK